MILELKPADTKSPQLRELIKELDAELLERYPGEGIFGMDLDSPEAKEASFFIASNGGIPVGCGAYRPLDGGAAEIKRFYVRREYRGHGVASRILSFLEESAKEEGFSVMRLETGPKQPEAIGLYHKFGYAEIPLFGEYLVSSKEFSICMEKRL